MRRLSVVEDRRVCGIGRIWWKYFVRNSEVRNKTMGSKVQSLEQALHLLQNGKKEGK